MKKVLCVLGVILLQACNMAIKDFNQSSLPVEGAFTIGGDVQGLPWGFNLDIFVNGQPILERAEGDGPFISAPINDEQVYDVTIGENLPGGYLCAVDNNQGVIQGSDIHNVLITCSCDRKNRDMLDLEMQAFNEIWTSGELDQISQNQTIQSLSKHYVQMCDLDFMDISDTKPIGNKDNPFLGSYDGQGLSIHHYASVDLTGIWEFLVIQKMRASKTSTSSIVSSMLNASMRGAYLT